VLVAGALYECSGDSSLRVADHLKVLTCASSLPS
jgi:hypothetical protein